MTTRVALVLAIVLGVVAAVAVRTYIEKDKEVRARAMDPVEVLVVKTNLRKGEVAAWEKLSYMPIPKPYVVRGMITKSDAPIFVNKVVTADVDAGSPLFKIFLQNRDENSDTVNQSVIPPDKRAVSIRIGMKESVSYTVKPGDLVDIIGTFEVTQSATPARTGAGSAVAPGALGKVSQTVPLLQAVKVLMVDNRTIDSTSGRDQDQYRNITFLLGPDEAVALINAEQEGRLQLLRRSRTDVNKPLKANTPYSWKNLGKQ